MTGNTQAERLARLEERFIAHAENTERWLTANAETAEKVYQKLDGMDERWDKRFNQLETAHRIDVANLTALENKGRGALMILGPLFLAVGAFVSSIWDQAKAAIFN